MGRISSWLSLVLVLGLAACSSNSTTANRVTSASTHVVATAAATVQTRSSVPTSTPPPTPTPAPSPTPTQSPVPTPTPTLAAPPPTQTPIAPIKYPLQGQGTSVSDNLRLAKGFTTFQLTYQGASNFIVHLLDGQGMEADLLVNTIGAYNGTTAYSVPDTGDYVLSVTASGPWTGEVQQPNVDNASASNSAQGKGDSVIYLQLKNGLNRLHFTHDGQRNFIVYLYNDAGDRNLLVNKIGPYDGTVAQSSSTGGVFALVVRADGNWMVSAQ